MALLTIQIVGWNSEQVLRPGLQALAVIPKDEIEIRYIDNASQDNSVELVKKILPQAHIVVLKTNVGFASAHNIGFSQCTTQLVMTHDPDVEIEWNGIKKILTAFADPTVGAVQGKLLRREKSTNNKPLIDSAGIVLSKALNGIERGSYEEDHGQYEQQVEVSAVTGACGIYRLEALKLIAYANHHDVLEIYDNDFFAYKEDVDVGWRLKRAGWMSLYVPFLVGHHSRSFGRRGFMNWGLGIEKIYARLKSPRTRYSLRNWIWMLVKNMSFKDELKAELFIDARLVVFFIFSLLYPPLFTVWPEIFKGIPCMLEKRRISS